MIRRRRASWQETQLGTLSNRRLSQRGVRTFPWSLVTGLGLVLALFGVGSVSGDDYVLDVEFVRTANDDGSEPSILTLAQAQAAIATTNKIWEKNGGGVRFRLYEYANFHALVKSTWLNNDCVPKGLVNSQTIQFVTDPDLNNDGVDANGEDAEVLCDYGTPKLARAAYAVQRPHRIVVFSRGGNEVPKFVLDSQRLDKGHWELVEKTGGFSGWDALYVVMPRHFGADTLLAHELGHYMNMTHTHGTTPKTLKGAATVIADWTQKNPRTEPTEVFDRDRTLTGWQFKVEDTPPDPGPDLFVAVHGSACDAARGEVEVAVGEDKFVLAPDRWNVMSYFKSCWPSEATDFYFSPDQLKWAKLALTGGNRQALLENEDPSGPCSPDQKISFLTQRTKPTIADLEGGDSSRRRLYVVEQDAHDLGDGDGRDLHQSSRSSPRIHVARQRRCQRSA